MQANIIIKIMYLFERLVTLFDILYYTYIVVAIFVLIAE